MKEVVEAVRHSRSHDLSFSNYFRPMLLPAQRPASSSVPSFRPPHRPLLHLEQLSRLSLSLQNSDFDSTAAMLAVLLLGLALGSTGVVMMVQVDSGRSAVDFEEKRVVAEVVAVAAAVAEDDVATAVIDLAAALAVEAVLTRLVQSAVWRESESVVVLRRAVN